MNAEEIQIWTDVDGMLTADPTILPGGHRVKTISFAEAAELVYFGAEGAASFHRASRRLSGNIPVLILEFAAAGSRGHEDRFGSSSLLKRGEVDRL